MVQVIGHPIENGFSAQTSRVASGHTSSPLFGSELPLCRIPPRLSMFTRQNPMQWYTVAWIEPTEVVHAVRLLNGRITAPLWKLNAHDPICRQRADTTTCERFLAYITAGHASGSISVTLQDRDVQSLRSLKPNLSDNTSWTPPFRMMPISIRSIINNTALCSVRIADDIGFS